MKSFFLPVRPPLSSAMQLPKKQPLPRFITLPAAAAVEEAQVAVAAVEAQAAVADTASNPPVLLIWHQSSCYLFNYFKKVSLSLLHKLQSCVSITLDLLNILK